MVRSFIAQTAKTAFGLRYVPYTIIETRDQVDANRKKLHFAFYTDQDGAKMTERTASVLVTSDRENACGMEKMEIIYNKFKNP